MHGETLKNLITICYVLFVGFSHKKVIFKADICKVIRNEIISIRIFFVGIFTRYFIIFY